MNLRASFVFKEQMLAELLISVNSENGLPRIFKLAFNDAVVNRKLTVFRNHLVKRVLVFHFLRKRVSQVNINVSIKATLSPCQPSDFSELYGYEVL